MTSYALTNDAHFLTWKQTNDSTTFYWSKIYGSYSYVLCARRGYLQMKYNRARFSSMLFSSI